LTEGLVSAAPEPLFEVENLGWPFRCSTVAAAVVDRVAGARGRNCRVVAVWRLGGRRAKAAVRTLGWERAGALVTLFAAPWGPKTPSLATPQFLFASDPIAKHDDDTGDEGPSQRPYETLTALAANLSLTIDASNGKNHYAKMVTSALACDGAVLIAWQHEDIALTTKTGGPGISQEILTQTGTTGTFNIPTSWPTGPAGARYDLVFVFDRPSGNGPMTGFTLLAQQLLAGDLP